MLVNKAGEKVEICQDDSLWSAVSGQVAYTAALNGHEDILRNLIISGFDVNTSVGFYGSVLGAACAKGQQEIVGLLLENMADLLPHGIRSPLELACAFGGPNIVAILIQNFKERNNSIRIPRSFSQDAVYYASMGRSMMAMTLLLEERGDINDAYGIYGTALGVACAQGDDASIDFLLQNGAHINQQGKLNSPLFWAYYYDHHDTASWLLFLGAKINSPLRRDFSLRIIELLCSTGAKLECVEDLHAAERYSFHQRITTSLWGSSLREFLCSGNNSRELWLTNLTLYLQKGPRNPDGRPVLEDPSRLPNCGCQVCFLDNETCFCRSTY
jgi:hypothetical protein